jgi:hypothetical protein
MLGRGSSLRINKLAAATLLTVLGAGTLVATTGSPASAYAFGVVSVSPSSNLVDNQMVTVTISGFGNDTGPATAGCVPSGTQTCDTTLYVVECTPKVVSTGGDTTYCDQSDPTAVGQSPTAPEHVVKITNASDGSATAQFPVHTGKDWLGPHAGAKCDHADSCVIVVTDGTTAATTSWAGFKSVSFKDLRAATKTTIKGKKSAKANSKVALAITTKHTKGTAKLTGKVVVKDGSKKCATVREKASGKVTAKCKIKSGKNKITAAFSGDAANYKPSTGKLTVVGKKK